MKGILERGPSRKKTLAALIAGSAKKRAVPNLFAMTSDDREKIGARNRPDLKTARQLHLSDLLRGPFDIKSVALTGLFILAVFYTMYFMRAMQSGGDPDRANLLGLDVGDFRDDSRSSDPCDV